MLAAYYSKGCESKEIFDGLKISELEMYLQHLNKYNVVFLNMQTFLSRAGNVGGLKLLIEDRVSGEICNELGIVKQEKDDLIEVLYKAYAKDNKGIIFLVDEWDCVFRNFKDDIVYSPRSVCAAIAYKDFSSYWSQTETFDALRTYIDLNFDGLKDCVIDLIMGKTFKVDSNSFQNDMTTFSTKDDVLTLLVHLGYLGFIYSDSEVYIPNHEVRDVFITSIKVSAWSHVSQMFKDSNDLHRVEVGPGCRLRNQTNKG